MSEIAIRAEGLSKVYRLGERERYSALRDTLARALRAPSSLLKREKRETFWALKDVNLEVKHGEVLGLIGRNGAGKTTLLKILSRITRPTSGWAEIYGRVGSLLEVGTGFHPELSGRDNIYLSGAILGMSKREIASKFDEIVAFAEIEKFLNMQVKHYSSGMYVRLAFAVAAHLDPEILLVDEVLAVGDIRFQKKCLGKMGDVARHGRTVIVVSHQMNQIRILCQRVIWVDGGTIRRDGNAHEVVSVYESAMGSGDRLQTPAPNEADIAGKPPSKARFVQWEIGSQSNEEAHVLKTFDEVTFKVIVDIRQPIEAGHYGVALRNHEQQVIWAWETQPLPLCAGKQELCHKFPILPLRPGLYTWLVALYEGGDPIDVWDCVPEMMVATENLQHPQDRWSGVLNIPTRFELQAGK